MSKKIEKCIIRNYASQIEKENYIEDKINEIIDILNNEEIKKIKQCTTD